MSLTLTKSTPYQENCRKKIDLCDTKMTTVVGIRSTRYIPGNDLPRPRTRGGQRPNPDILEFPPPTPSFLVPGVNVSITLASIDLRIRLGKSRAALWGLGPPLAASAPTNLPQPESLTSLRDHDPGGGDSQGPVLSLSHQVTHETSTLSFPPKSPIETPVIVTLAWSDYIPSMPLCFT